MSLRSSAATWSWREPRVPLGEVELEVGVAARALDRPRERRLGERRPAEVRVHDHAGRVQHAPERRAPRLREPLVQPGGEVAGIAPRADVLTCLGQDHAGRVDRQRIVDATRQLVHRRQVP